MLEYRARFSRTADHSQKKEGLVYPILQDKRIVAVAARDDQGKAGYVLQRQGEEFLPHVRLQGHFAGEVLVIGQGGAVVEDGDGKMQLQRQRGDCLSDVAGAGNPESAGWRDGFQVEQIAVCSSP